MCAGAVMSSTKQVYKGWLACSCFFTRCSSGWMVLGSGQQPVLSGAAHLLPLSVLEQALYSDADLENADGLTY